MKSANSTRGTKPASTTCRTAPIRKAIFSQTIPFQKSSKNGLHMAMCRRVKTTTSLLSTTTTTMAPTTGKTAIFLGTTSKKQKIAAPNVKSLYTVTSTIGGSWTTRATSIPKPAPTLSEWKSGHKPLLLLPTTKSITWLSTTTNSLTAAPKHSTTPILASLPTARLATPTTTT